MNTTRRESGPRGGGWTRGRLTMVTMIAVATAVSACGTDKSPFSGKDELSGLDKQVLRGDSLLAIADQSALIIDSMKAAMRTELAKAELAPVAESDDGTLSLPGAEAARDARDAAIASSALSAGSAMSQRAQARGDSMARAIALRLAGDVSGDRARSDTARGILAFQGKEPARAVVLRVGGNTIALSGMATTGLSRFVGTEVMVRGMNVSPRDIVVADFIVRAADGVPAYDGVLLDEGTLRLTDGSGVKRVPVPPALQGMEGARVWIAVRDGTPTAYGVVGRR